MDQRNLLVAIVLSVGILIAFQFLFAKLNLVKTPPPAPPAPTQTEQKTRAAPGTTSVPNATVAAKPAAAQTPEQALAGQPIVKIETPDLSGSISLNGGRIDNLELMKYHETVDPSSAHVRLLRPTGTAQPYFAQFGWTPVEPESVKVPGPDTLWQTQDRVLTPTHPVTLAWDNGQGVVFTRTISVDKDYMFRITDNVRNTSTAPVTLVPYGLISRSGAPPAAGYSYREAYQGMIGEFDGSLKEVKYASVKPGEPVAYSSNGAWLGFSEDYWLTALIPPQQQIIKAQFRAVDDHGADRYQSDFLAPPISVPAGGAADYAMRFYAGAKELSILDTYANAGIRNFDRAVDFGVLYFLSKPIFQALEFLNNLLGNFGLAIVVFTLAVKLAFFPLANKSYSAMAKMRLLQPEMQKIRERFPDDKAKQQQETMALYKRVGANPLAGCLPIVIQIPVFWALYEVLYVSIEMRHAPFYGWVHDLSAPDPSHLINLFGLLPFDPTTIPLISSVPILSSILLIGAWPIIMGCTMFLQQKLNPQPVDPIQARMFMALPVVFTYMLSAFPAGLVIYWAWNNLLSIAQQWMIMHRAGAA